MFAFLIYLLFSCGHHFVVEEIEERVHLVEAQGALSLFKVAHKSQADARFEREVLLRQPVLFAQLLYGFGKISHIFWFYTLTGAKLINYFHIASERV